MKTLYNIIKNTYLPYSLFSKMQIYFMNYTNLGISSYLLVKELQKTNY